MKKLFSLIALPAIFLAACSSDDPEPEVPNDNNGGSKYVLMTMSERNPTKPGTVTAFDTFPSGEISNVVAGKSLSGSAMGGIRTYKNWIFKMFNTSASEKGIERLKINSDGSVEVDQFLKTGAAYNGSGNFVIVDDQTGYYWNADKQWEIQVFDPSTVSHKRTLGNYEELRKDNEGIMFQAIGQHFLAVKDDYLFADITYSTGADKQAGFFGTDFFPDVHIAVIKLPEGTLEKTIKIANTGSITYWNENEMYDFDSNGDLYIVTQGNTVEGGNSKLVRIKANETDIDTDWEINMDDFNAPIGGKFTGVFVKNGKIITLIPNTTVTRENINEENIWDFYIIDATTKQKTKITGIPSVSNPGAAYAVTEVDDKILLRGSNADLSTNSYYELSGTNAVPTFTVTEGGSLSGIYKIEIQ